MIKFPVIKTGCNFSTPSLSCASVLLINRIYYERLNGRIAFQLLVFSGNTERREMSNITLFQSCYKSINQQRLVNQTDCHRLEPLCRCITAAEFILLCVSSPKRLSAGKRSIKFVNNSWQINSLVLHPQVSSSTVNRSAANIFNLIY